jgi:hypothetical protein
VVREVFAKLEGDAFGQDHSPARAVRFPLARIAANRSHNAAGLLSCLRRIEARGTLETAHRVHQNCGQIFRYAIATGRAERDPAADLRGALPPAAGGHFATWRLYLPQEWADDKRRREKVGVPEEVEFATKNEIAQAQLRAAKATGVPVGVVLADPAYGNDTSFREALRGMDLSYCVGVQSSTTVWTSGKGPRRPEEKKKRGRGRPATRCFAILISHRGLPKRWRCPCLRARGGQ